MTKIAKTERALLLYHDLC